MIPPNADRKAPVSDPNPVVPLVLPPRAAKIGRRGHPWFYADDFEGVTLPDRALVRVHAPGGRDLGLGFTSTRSKIALRLAGRWEGDGVPSVEEFLAAPDTEAELPEAYGRLTQALSAGQSLVAVHAGTPLTRSLLAEQARLVHRVPALIVEDGMDDDRAETLLLSGRADLVGSLSEQGERA